MASPPPVLVQPICVGTVSFYLGKRADPSHSHRWTVYLRGAANEDLSWLIEDVTFSLHESFTDPNRTIQTQPYQVTETGWGEFDINVTIRLLAPFAQEKLVVKHPLRLYPEDDSSLTVKKPVVTETYDEIVIQDPSSDVRQLWAARTQLRAPESPIQQYFLVHSENKELAALRLARSKVVQHTNTLQAKYAALDRSLDKNENSILV